LQAHLQTERHRRPDLDVLHVGSEARSRDRHVVRIERHVREAEIARLVGQRGPLKSADRVMNRDGRTRDHGAGGVRDGSPDGPRVPRRLGV
jgi:hypothetical protein